MYPIWAAEEKATIRLILVFRIADMDPKIIPQMPRTNRILRSGVRDKTSTPTDRR